MSHDTCNKEGRRLICRCYSINTAKNPKKIQQKTQNEMNDSIHLFETNSKMLNYCYEYPQKYATRMQIACNSISLIIVISLSA